MQPELETLTLWVRAVEPAAGVSFAGSLRTNIYHTPSCAETYDDDLDVSNISFTDIVALCTSCIADTPPLLAWVVDPVHRRMLEAYHALHTLNNDTSRLTRVAEEISLGRTGHELASTMIILDLAERYDTLEREIRGYAVEIGAGYNDLAGQMVADALEAIDQQRDSQLRTDKRIDALRNEVTNLYGIAPAAATVICGVDTVALRAGLHEAVGRLREGTDDDLELEQGWQSREPAVHLLVSEALEAVFMRESDGPRQVRSLPRWAYDAFVLLCGRSALSDAYLSIDNAVLATATTLWLDTKPASGRAQNVAVYSNFDACVAAAELL